MKNCIFTGLPTSKNFRQYPIHSRIIEIARDLRDKEPQITVRQQIKKASEIFIEELKKRSN